MKNHFVTYHQSQALGKLGFDLPCMPEYNLPLRSQAIQWFRDKHQLYGSVETDCTTYPKFCYVVKEFFGNPKDLTEKEWGWKDGLYSVLYREYAQAEKELIDYLISKIDEGYEIE